MIEKILDVRLRSKSIFLYKRGKKKGDITFDPLSPTGETGLEFVGRAKEQEKPKASIMTRLSFSPGTGAHNCQSSHYPT